MGLFRGGRAGWRIEKCGLVGWCSSYYPFVKNCQVVVVVLVVRDISQALLYLPEVAVTRDAKIWVLSLGCRQREFSFFFKTVSYT